MFRKIAAAALVAAAMAGAVLATTGTAEARYGRNGAFAAGALGGLLLGGIVANSYAQPTYGYSYGYAPACWWRNVRVNDGYGYFHYERVQVCR